MNVKSKNEPKEVLSFRKLLINRCQTQFEKERTDEMEMLEKQKQIDECFVVGDGGWRKGREGGVVGLGVREEGNVVRGVDGMVVK